MPTEPDTVRPARLVPAGALFAALAALLAVAVGWLTPAVRVGNIGFVVAAGLYAPVLVLALAQAGLARVLDSHDATPDRARRLLLAGAALAGLAAVAVLAVLAPPLLGIYDSPVPAPASTAAVAAVGTLAGVGVLGTVAGLAVLIRRG